MYPTSDGARDVQQHWWELGVDTEFLTPSQGIFENDFKDKSQSASDFAWLVFSPPVPTVVKSRSAGFVKFHCANDPNLKWRELGTQSAIGRNSLKEFISALSSMLRAGDVASVEYIAGHWVRIRANPLASMTLLRVSLRDKERIPSWGSLRAEVKRQLVSEGSDPDIALRGL